MKPFGNGSENQISNSKNNAALIPAPTVMDLK
jgi:hypothetical protein